MTTFFVMAPSFFSQIGSGVLLFYIVFIFFTNFKTFLNLDPVNKISTIGILSIAFAVHGLLHLGLERVYNYNPLLTFCV